VCEVIKENHIIFVTGIAVNGRGPNIRMHNLKREECLMHGRVKRKSNMLSYLAGVTSMEGRLITLKIEIVQHP
jgi:hypothetical protein